MLVKYLFSFASSLRKNFRCYSSLKIIKEIIGSQICLHLHLTLKTFSLKEGTLNCV